MPFLSNKKHTDLLEKISVLYQKNDKSERDFFYLQNKIEKIIQVLEVHARSKADQIVGIRETKYGDFVLLTELAIESKITFRIYSSEDNKADCYLEGTLHSKKLCATIIDIVGETSLGYGSILLSHFIELCKNQKIDTIDGILSPKDSDHFDRSEKFYKKHGFTVCFNENRTSGTIKLNLNQKHTE